MKAMYTTIGDNVYRVLNKEENPAIIARLPKNPNNVTINEDAKTIATNVYAIVDGDTTDKANNELYQSLVDKIKSESIYEIPSLKNEYVMVVDYTILNSRNEKVDRNLAMKRLKPRDVAIIMGVDVDNRCTYRFAKQLETSLAIQIDNMTPYGIMTPRRRDYKLVLNDVIIYQDFNCKKRKRRIVSSRELKSLIAGKSQAGALGDMLLIYSSADEALTFDPITLPFLPIRVEIGINIINTNFVVAYDDNAINTILDENKPDESDQDDTDLKFEIIDDVEENTDTGDDTTDESTDDAVSGVSYEATYDESDDVINIKI